MIFTHFKLFEYACLFIILPSLYCILKFRICVFILFEIENLTFALRVGFNSLFVRVVGEREGKVPLFD